jgi:HEPN domain-containing protein
VFLLERFVDSEIFSTFATVTTIIMVNDKVAYWIDIADYDLKTAEAMHQTGRWLYVAFMCHQVIEKALKAYWCGTRFDTPPYTHHHMRLAEGCGLYDKMSDEQKDFLDLVTNYNIEARYPEDKEALAQTLSPQVCRQLIDETKIMMTWITEQLSAVTKP